MRFHHDFVSKRLRKTDERGWVLMCGALVATVLFGLLGLAFDAGLLQMHRLRAQMAADNAAVAGALEMRNGTGNQVAAAKATAKLNGFDHGVNGDTVSVTTIELFTPRTFMNVGFTLRVTSTRRLSLVMSASGPLRSTSSFMVSKLTGTRR